MLHSLPKETQPFRVTFINYFITLPHKNLYIIELSMIINFFREDASMCQGALRECNIFTALSTIQILLLEYQTEESLLFSANLIPPNTTHHGENSNIVIPIQTHSLDILSKTEIPRIKDEISENVPNLQTDSSRKVDVSDSFRTVNRNGGSILTDVNAEDECNYELEINSLLEHKETANDCTNDGETKTSAMDTLHLQGNTKDTKRRYSMKAINKFSQKEQKITTKLKEPKFSCSVCNKGYNRKKLLDKHLKMVHNIEETKEFQCAECQILFNHQSKLDHHMTQTHVPQTCTECSEIFTGTVHLNIHMKHHKEAPIAANSTSIMCELCGKEYCNQYRLKEHLRKKHGHVDPGLISCDICQTTFHRKSSLKKHMIQHESGFRCHVCSETFTDLIKLKKHQWKHWKKYCKLCPAQFPHRSNDLEVITTF